GPHLPDAKSCPERGTSQHRVWTHARLRKVAHDASVAPQHPPSLQYNESDARIQQPMRKVVYGLEQLVQCDQAQHRKVMLLSGKPRYHAEYVMSDDWRDAEKQQRNNGEEQEASASLLPAYDGGADADAGRRHRASRPARATCDESG